jgi:hypothetical protein
MSGDEVVVLIGSALLSIVCWGTWFIAPTLVRRFAGRATGRSLLYLAPVAAVALLFLVLRTASAHDVRDDPRYLSFYLVLGAAWTGVSIRWLPLAGVSARDDVVERGNVSAAAVVAGALLAITLCYAGGNIGDGPGWWVVVFSAALSTAGLFVAWMLLEVVSRISDTVTIDRDVAAGVRLAAFLVAAGLILGRSVAGNWISAQATVADFAAAAWPALILVAVAAWIERWLRPTPDNPRPGVAAHGLVPAVLYVSLAIYHVSRLGLPI